MKTLELKKSPMFNLFLSSKELFHSNFINWLIAIDPENMSTVFSHLVDRQIKIENCEREKKSFDLFIHCRGGVDIIVENKFKSIITLDQLEKYNKTNKNPNAIKILLTLNSKNHEKEVSDKAGWLLVSYEMLVSELNKIKLKERYHQSLLKDYCGFVSIISNHFSEMDYLNTTISKMKSEYNELKSIKLHDIYQKILFSFLQSELDHRLKKKESESKGEAEVFRRLSTWAGFTNGTGLVSINYNISGDNDLRKGTRLELQLQFSNLKLMFIHAEGPRKLGKKVLDPYFRIIEDIASTTICEVDRKNKVIVYPKGMKDYNRYGDNLIYKNIKLSSKLTMNEISELMIQILEEIIVYGENYQGSS